MSKHTSGPWTWEYSNDTGPNDDYFIEFFEIRSQDGIKIAEVAEQEDARLIAAAPDLLEFAEEVRRNGDTRLASMAIAIIAKATGETNHA